MRWLVCLVALFCGLATPASAQISRPNIVFVLTDDLSWNLIPYMRNVQALQRQGVTFDRFVVTNSLCCPSRASILTGRYPHSTGVLTNMPPAGGFETFHMFEEWSTFATSLQSAGYMTALMGKYLNGYRPNWYTVPPGWTAWAAAGEAYGQFDYTQLVKDPGALPELVRHGHQPRDYLTDVINRRGRQFVTRAVQARRPFLLELSTFAPHEPFTPAPRDALSFPALTTPRSSLFDAPQLAGAPSWLPSTGLSARRIARLDRDFRKRVQSVQAVDRMIGDLRTHLRRLGVAHNTYIVFASDNGFHMGERRLLDGKQSAFDHDVRVPLIVAGPGVPAGTRVGQIASNIDLRPTFQELGGALIGPSVEGRSLVGFLRGQAPASWREKILIEHRHSNQLPGDPDRQGPGQGKPPSYHALRFADALYVEYENPRLAPEYYDLVVDPDERDNIYATLTPERRAELSIQLQRLRACEGAAACQAADR
jgi:arylsulfatase A-like enzyme